MSVSFDVLFLRRPRIDYVSPPVCEAIFSGSGSPIIVLDPFDALAPIDGIVVEGGGDSHRIVRWPAYPGAICYTVYLDEDGVLTVIFECLTDPEAEIPDDITGPIRIAPITEDGEGPVSDPIELPPMDGGGGGDCEVFIDDTLLSNSPDLPNKTNRLNGIVVGARNLPGPVQRPWMYLNRVSSDIRTSRSSGVATGSQSASDLVNTDGTNFFEAGDVGKFLQFTSGGDAREIVSFISPTQVQVAVVDTVASSTFSVYGRTIGGASGSIDIANGSGHIVGNENDPLSNNRIFWFNLNTGDFRDLGDWFSFIPIALNENGFLLHNNSTDCAYYDPGTQAVTVLPSGLSVFDFNNDLLVVGTFFTDHFPQAGENQATKWQAGVTTNINPVLAGTGPGTFSRCEKVNEAGLIIGRFDHVQGDATIRVRTFYNNGGASTSIGFFVVGTSAATGWMVGEDLNEAGMLVGGGDIEGTTGTGIPRGFKWTLAGGLVQLGVIAGQPDSYAEGVNEAGIIVGESGTKACIWLPGQTVPQDLNNYLPPDSGWVLTRAEAITNDNEVIGMGNLNGDFKPFFMKLCL